MLNRPHSLTWSHHDWSNRYCCHPINWCRGLPNLRWSEVRSFTTTTCWKHILFPSIEALQITLGLGKKIGKKCKQTSPSPWRTSSSPPAGPGAQRSTWGLEDNDSKKAWGTLQKPLAPNSPCIDSHYLGVRRCCSHSPTSKFHSGWRKIRGDHWSD